MNPHGLASTCFQGMRVCQFRHPRIRRAGFMIASKHGGGDLGSSIPTEISLGGTNTMSRVALFVDGANMFYAQRDNGWHIDFRLVHQYFFRNRERAAAYYFTASPSAGDQIRVDKYRRFKTALIHLGYSVVDKEVKVITDRSSPEQVKVKGNLDIELVFKMIVESAAYDEVVLMGGDADYVPIINHLRNIGKIVVVVARRQSTSMDLINAATRFIDLESIRSEIEKEPTGLPRSKKVVSQKG